ncbi:MAG: hypothetical protein U0R44_05350 [Candidatus Micrarchaeia archaeon]
MAVNCGICGCRMLSVPSARFTQRKEIEEKITSALGELDGSVDREFEATSSLRVPDFEVMLTLLAGFLAGREIRKVLFFPKAWWIRCGHFYEMGAEDLAVYQEETGAVRFGSSEDAIRFLRANMLYGTSYEYFIMDEGFAWLLTISKEMELRFSGSREFLDEVGDRGAAEP